MGNAIAQMILDFLAELRGTGAFEVVWATNINSASADIRKGNRLIARVLVTYKPFSFQFCDMRREGL